MGDVLVMHCQLCGAEFEPRSPSAKFCQACRAEARRRYLREYFKKNRERYLESWRTSSRIYYQKNREKMLEKFKQRYQSQKKEWIRRVVDYRRRNVRKYRVYKGSITCPKCGRRGQLKHNVEENIKTGNRRVYAVVAHYQSVWQDNKVKKIYLGTCYIGRVK